MYLCSCFKKKTIVKQASFNARFEDGGHHGMSDGLPSLIKSRKDLQRIEFVWQCELDTFKPNGLNERNVAFFWRIA